MSCSEAEELEVLSVVFHLNLIAVAERRGCVTAARPQTLHVYCSCVTDDHSAEFLN